MKNYQSHLQKPISNPQNDELALWDVNDNTNLENIDLDPNLVSFESINTRNHVYSVEKYVKDFLTKWPFIKIRDVEKNYKAQHENVCSWNNIREYFRRILHDPHWKTFADKILKKHILQHWNTLYRKNNSIIPSHSYNHFKLKPLCNKKIYLQEIDLIMTSLLVSTRL